MAHEQRVNVVKDVLIRLGLGDGRHRLRFETIPTEDGLDVFECESAGDVAIIRGSSPVAQLAGLNWFLKYGCNSHVSWWGSRLELPERFPELRLRVVSPYRYRYYLNYVTYSYSMAFWDWERWEREIDWMALQGINLPLSVLGQASIWRSVYRAFGLSDEELAAFFTGPAFQPFGWMGCMDGWGGPLTNSLIDRHEEMQKQIVRRQRELGMKPVLQGFTGHVPAALLKQFPRARHYTQQWLDFAPTYVLDPHEPLFQEIGAAFIREQAARYGSDHIYAADPFIEMDPPSKDPGFLAAWASAIYEGMRRADPQAVWLVQTWMFHFRSAFWGPEQIEAFLTSMPDDRLIALDLYAEESPQWQKTHAFHGKPWIWCMLHNFGGNSGMYGNLRRIGQNLPAALGHSERKQLQGTGLTMEAIEQNPVVYDLMAELAWRKDPVNVDEWIIQYVRRRYGRACPEAEAAWKILVDTLYSAEVSLPPRSVICRRPTLETFVPPGDQVKACYESLGLLLSCSDVLRSADGYRYDLVDLTRQAMSDLAAYIHRALVQSYAKKDCASFDRWSRLFLELLQDLDRVLATHPAFLLGPWIEAAKALGSEPDEQANLEWNARNLLTLWGPPGSVLHDYASRHWAGLLGSFYYVRWRMFLDEAAHALESGQVLDEEALRHEITRWEEEWVKGRAPYPTEPTGDVVGECAAAHAKYETVMRVLV